MTLEALIPFGKVRWTSLSMFVPMALIGVCLVGATPSSAVIMDFLEMNESSNILVRTNITGAMIVTSPERAEIDIGNVDPRTTLFNLLFRRQMVDANESGISDVLSLFTYYNATGVVGFQAIFESDTPEGFGTFTMGNFPPRVRDLIESGRPQLISRFFVFLPGLGRVPLEVGVQSDVDVPGPVVGAGLPGFLAACGGLLAWWRRRRRRKAA
jgi:hypothetical protein